MSYQCYFTDEEGKRCEGEQEDCWCSEKHKQLWQKQTYGVNKREHNSRLTIPEIQERLKEMAVETRIKTEKSGQRKMA